MTDPPDPHHLHDVLDRATDRVESPALAASALGTARRRRARRRGAAAALASGVAVAVVVVATQVGGGSTAGPAPSTSTPSDTPTSVPVDVQEPWDPTRVAELPPAPDGVAPFLPDVVDPPADAPLLSDDPVSAVALAVQSSTDRTTYLLGVDGSWRRLVSPGEFPNVALSPDGSRLVVWQGVLGFPATVVEVATGERRALARPAGFENSDLTSVAFVSDTQIRVDGRTPLTIDALTGESELAARSATGRLPRVLEGYGALSELRLSSVASRGGVVAGTTDDGGVAVVVADERTSTPYAVLPVGTRPGVFGGGKGLNLVGVTDDGTVLLRVNLFELGREGFDIVAWDPATGAVTAVSRFPEPTYATYAEALLG